MTDLANVTPISPAAAEEIEKIRAQAKGKGKGRKAKASKPDAELPETPAPVAPAIVFESTREVASRLVKTLDAASEARAKRKTLGDRFRDEIKQAEEKLAAAVADLDGSDPVKKAWNRDERFREGAVEARTAAKKVRGERDEKLGDAKGKVGAAWKAYNELLEERAKAKAKAGKKLRDAEAEVGDLVAAAKAQATQLSLAL